MRRPRAKGSRLAPMRRLSKGVFLLPSALTTGNMLLGFFAVVRGLEGDFELAALLIFCAAVLDALDGRLARLTGTTSDFGAQLDSLADMVTFGMTPALLSYCWGLDVFGRAGWLIPLFYLVCTATRLARFNVHSGQEDPRFFVGLPSPAAAGAICSILFFIPNPTGLEPEVAKGFGVLLLLALLAVGSLMVSTFRFFSLKRLELRKAHSYRMMLPVAAVLLVAAWRPTAFFLSVASLYTLSGPALWTWNRFQRGGKRDAGAVESPKTESTSEAPPEPLKTQQPETQQPVTQQPPETETEP